MYFINWLTALYFAAFEFDLCCVFSLEDLNDISWKKWADEVKVFFSGGGLDWLSTK